VEALNNEIHSGGPDVCRALEDSRAVCHRKGHGYIGQSNVARDLKTHPGQQRIRKIPGAENGVRPIALHPGARRLVAGGI
jgi:hypothetical protein